MYRLFPLSLNRCRICEAGFSFYQTHTKRQLVAPLLLARRTMSYDEMYKLKDTNNWVSKRIGNREIVGFGLNGEPEYFDKQDFPFPSIRYKPPLPEIQALREKEKGDWRLLAVEEKKALYRASFRQTFAEFLAPTGDWMSILGYVFIFTSIGLWMFIFEKIFVYPQTPMPNSFHPNNQKLQMQRILNIRANPVTGLSSKWDYKEKKWKSKPWYIPWDDPFEDIEECEEDLED